MAKATTTKKKRNSTLSRAHLDALEQGRRAGRAVRAYLEYLDRTRAPMRRGRKVDWQAKLDDAQSRLETATDPVERLFLIQTVYDAEGHLNVAQENAHVEILEAGFVQWAKIYSASHKITYTAWRQIGVPASMLKKAGITR